MYKIIHQLWKNENIPIEWIESHNQYKKLYNDYKYILWTDQTMKEFIEKNYNWFLHTYNNYKYNIQRVDAFRYFVLYHMGGIYSDLDIIPLKKMDILLQYDNSIPITKNKNIFSGLSLTNSFMCSKPQSQLMKYCIDNLILYKDKKKKLGRHLHVLSTTGPMFLSNIVKKYYKGYPTIEKDNIYIIPEKLFNPPQKDYSICKHLPGGSWHSYDSQLFDFILHNQISLLNNIFNLSYQNLEKISKYMSVIYYMKNKKNMKEFHKNVSIIEKYTNKKIDKRISIQYTIFTLLSILHMKNYDDFVKKINYLHDFKNSNIYNNLDFSKQYILISAHYSYFNIIASFLKYFKDEVVLLVEYFQNKTSMLYQIMQNYNKINNLIKYDVKGNTQNDCLKFLKNKKNLLILCDRNKKKEGQKIKFFGKEIVSPWYSCCYLSKTSNVPLLLYFPIQNKSGKIDILWEIIYPQNDLLKMQYICRDLFEKYICKDLNQWNILTKIW